MPDLPPTLHPSPPHGSTTLTTARNTSSLPIRELSHHLLSHNAFLPRQIRLLPLLQDEPLFQKRKQLNLSRPERYRLGLARAKRLRRLADEHGWNDLDHDMAVYLVDDVSPFMLHGSMFVTTVREQGSEAQKREWLGRIERWECVGCYAQTELGHGSNVRGLETQARWDPKRKEFSLHSPSLTAAKWWNGSMGRTANVAIVVAQLLVPEGVEFEELVSFGPHPFIVQIRDWKTHEPLDGIVVGDIGVKYGYQPMDNGYMLFNHHRVSHDSMLSRYSWVDPNTCTYSKPSNPAVVYGSLTAIRAAIIMHARLVLARAVTVAVRYTAIRHQFQDRDSMDKSAPEIPVLDYPTVQIRVLPLLATAFALHYTGEAMHSLYQNTRADIDKGDFSKLAALHAQSSGLKSLCTELAANGIETCRRAMGGHGYGGGSGLIQLNADYLSKPTVEGDNWMITQQTASYLIKRMQGAVKAKPDLQDEVERDYQTYLMERDKYVASDLDILNDDAHVVEAFKRRSQDQTYRAYIERVHKKRSWNDLLIQLRKVSHAESQSIIVGNFHAALSNHRLSPTLHEHLRRLFRLFAFYTLEAEGRDFVKAKAISDDALDELPERIQALMKEIRPHAVSLVDAWQIPDFLLDSALGRSDGKVYEDLFDRAHRLNPLNEVTFNPDYRSDEIEMGDEGRGLRDILAKL